MKFKLKNGMSPTINSEDIIPTINYAWNSSFAKVKTNKQAISERGWYPYNRNLLLNAQIRATMTNEERNNEKGLVPIHLKQNYIEIDDDAPFYEQKYLQKPTKDSKNNDFNLNLSQGSGLESIKDIIDAKNINEAR